MTKSMTAPKRMSSGKYVDLADMNKYAVDLKDINTALNYIYRFTGHYQTNPPLTVAQHTKLCVQLSNMLFPGELDVELDCLLHDFEEAYVGDIATPLKKMFGATARDYAAEVAKCVYDRYWIPQLPYTKDIVEKRKICDLLSLDIERRNMWASHAGKDHWPDIPMEGVISSKQKTMLFETVQAERLIDLEAMYAKLHKQIMGVLDAERLAKLKEKWGNGLTLSDGSVIFIPPLTDDLLPH